MRTDLLTAFYWEHPDFGCSFNWQSALSYETDYAAGLALAAELVESMTEKHVCRMTGVNEWGEPVDRIFTFGLVKGVTTFVQWDVGQKLIIERGTLAFKVEPDDDWLSDAEVRNDCYDMMRGA